MNIVIATIIEYQYCQLATSRHESLIEEQLIAGY